MDEKYIVIKGDAETNNTNVNQLDNTCDICHSWDDAYFAAMAYCYQGARRAQIYKLEAEFEVDKVSMTKGGETIENEFTPEGY